MKTETRPDPTIQLNKWLLWRISNGATFKQACKELDKKQSRAGMLVA